MKIRLLTGSCYIAVLLVFYLLKIFVHDLCFDALTYVFALVGTFEMLRAMKDKTTKAERAIVFAFAILVIPACAIGEYFLGIGLLCTIGCFFLLSVALLTLLVAKHEETTIESLGTAFLSAVYPSLLLCLLVLANHISVDGLSAYALNGDLAILFVFVVSPFADSLAYVFGRFLKKYFPKKMAPKLSPNKTVIGGIGGIVGGMVGATILYFSYTAVAIGSFEKIYLMLPLYLGLGVLLAVATAFGDLVESSLKRKVDLKDMGKIMPGHGGVLDRIDGSLFATVVVYATLFVLALIF